MAGYGMRHETSFPVEHLRQRDLPDAPLLIERQIIERAFAWPRFARLWSWRVRRG